MKTALLALLLASGVPRLAHGGEPRLEDGFLIERAEAARDATPRPVAS